MRLIREDMLDIIERNDAARRLVRLATDATDATARRAGDVVRFDSEYGTLIHERTVPNVDSYHVSRGQTGEPSEANRTHRGHDTSLYPRTGGIAVSPDATTLEPSVRVNGETVTVSEFRAKQRAARRKQREDIALEREATRARLRESQGNQSEVD